MFKLERGAEKLIASLYVDDGVCASNSDELYRTFLADRDTVFLLRTEKAPPLQPYRGEPHTAGRSRKA
eukprot:2735200-Rhodomonas_salina.1